MQCFYQISLSKYFIISFNSHRIFLAYNNSIMHLGKIYKIFEFSLRLRTQFTKNWWKVWALKIKQMKNHCWTALPAFCTLCLRHEHTILQQHLNDYIHMLIKKECSHPRFKNFKGYYVFYFLNNVNNNTWQINQHYLTRT